MASQWDHDEGGEVAYRLYLIHKEGLGNPKDRYQADHFMKEAFKLGSSSAHDHFDTLKEAEDLKENDIRERLAEKTSVSYKLLDDEEIATEILIMAREQTLTIAGLAIEFNTTFEQITFIIKEYLEGNKVVALALVPPLSPRR